MFSVKSKVAIVTGGASGIGLATAKRLVAAGATVVIANRRDSSALAKSMGASYLKCDVSLEADVEAVMKEVRHRHGQIDVLVNNAGYGEVGATAESLTQRVVEKHFDTNVLGIVYGVKHAVAHMTRGGSIINIGSIAGLIGIPAYGAYVASKFAAIGLTKTAAIELAGRRIRVNCICPGTIDTPINQQAGAEAELTLVKTLAPSARIGEAEEVAALVHFLAADDCRYMTGEVICVDGGWLAGPSVALIERVVGSAGAQS